MAVGAQCDLIVAVFVSLMFKVGHVLDVIVIIVLCYIVGLSFAVDCSVGDCSCRRRLFQCGG